MSKKKKAAKELQAYLAKHEITDAAFAEQVGIHPTYVGMLLRGSRTPGLQIAMAIQEATHRHVLAQDWL